MIGVKRHQRRLKNHWDKFKNKRNNQNKLNIFIQPQARNKKDKRKSQKNKNPKINTM